MRPAGILIGICVVVIAASLGIVLHFSGGVTIPVAILSALLAAMVMALLQILVSHSRAQGRIHKTLDGLQRANARLVGDMERLAGELHGLGDAGQRVSQVESNLANGFSEQIDERIRTEVNKAKASLVSEMQVIETLVKQLAESVAPLHKDRDGAAARGEAWAEDGEAPVPQEPRFDDTGFGDDGFDGSRFDDPRFDDLDGFGGRREEDAARNRELLETVRQSIQDNRVDVYLQPIVTLPQRKPRYYEALTRLRNGEGEIILPADYLEVAEPAGIMPLIDNLLLFRSVQIVRKLSDRNREIGIFCNISANSLVDPDFFPQFIEFMEHNRDLAKSIVFEFSQATISGAGPLETESLAALRQQGCRFSIDHVQNLDLDLPALAEQGFRFLKVDAATLLAGAPAGAQIHMDDYSSLLARYGITLVAEKIETERTVLELLELDVGFGQGFLFSEPRPVRSEFLEGDAPPPLRAAV